MALFSSSILTPGAPQNATASSVSSLGISGVNPMKTLPIAVLSATAFGCSDRYCGYSTQWPRDRLLG